MKKWQVYSILTSIIILAATLNYLPHLNYNYPLHVDEWVHFQYANHLSANAPQYFGTNQTSLENGFHILLASLNSIGVPYLILFKFFPIIFIILISLSIFIAARRIFNEKAALFSVLFVALLQSTVAILGPMFLVPMSLGLFLIAIGLFLLEINSNLFFLPLIALLIIHPPSALAYFLIINIHLVIKRKAVIKTIALEILAFILALPLYLSILAQKGLDTVNALNFPMIIDPIFIPRFLGYFTIILIACGIYFSLLKKRYDLTAYSIVFLFLISLFYKLNIELFIPYARTLMCLFLIFAILFGFGCSELVSLSKNKKIKVIVLILLVALILFFSFPAKIDSTKPIYHIIEDGDYKAFNYIKDNTPKDSIVLADPWVSNAITPIAERQVYSRIVQGPSAFYEARNNEIQVFFADNCTDTNLLKQNNISIVYGDCKNPTLDEIYPKVFKFSG